MRYPLAIHEVFDGYTLRSVDEEMDRGQLAEWIGRDRYHAGVMTPEFFLGIGDSRPSCYALEDAAGTLFFIRISRAARVYMQFQPVAGVEQRRRIAAGLFKGMAFLEAGLSRAGCEQWVFDTQSPGLKYLSQHRLGFTLAPDDLVRDISPPEVEQEQVLQ